MSDCIVCGLPAQEKDHFPIAKRHGGTKTIDLCRGCHDMKDRIPFDRWNPLARDTAWKGLWEKLDRNQRILLLKLCTIISDVAPEVSP